MAKVQADYYEEMFREITKKFYYGDDDDDLDANPSPDMDKTHDLLEDDFRADKEDNAVLNDAADLSNDYESAADVTDSQLPKFTLNEENWVCSEETISWTTSKIASYSATQKLFRCNECECIGFLSRIAEHWLGSHANLRVFQCSQCSYASAWARCVKMHLARLHHDICPESTSDEELQKLMKVNPVLDEVTKYLEKLKSKLELPDEKEEEKEAITAEPKPEPKVSVENSTDNQVVDNVTTEIYALASVKRYNCEHCSYATDRKDLFTRHENIHREEKPFQCNVCQKQFNRADHIKKHFIRMHRDHEYLLSNVRRAKAPIRSGIVSSKPKEKIVLTTVPMCVPQSLTEPATLQSIIQRAIPTTVVISAESLAASTQIIQETHPSVIQSTNMQEFLQQNDADQVDISFFGTHTLLISTETKQMKDMSSQGKSRSRSNIEKCVKCSYCSWTGVDNWCLKRHLNTHIKPFACSLCEYKAARSERLTTHIFRVHNKRACTKCSFLADDMLQLTAHQLENHKSTRLRKKLKSTIDAASLKTVVTSTPVIIPVTTSILQ